jgi:hypothetical protein
MPGCRTLAPERPLDLSLFESSGLSAEAELKRKALAQTHL